MAPCLVDSFQVIPHFVGSAILSCVNLLWRQDVLIYKYGGIRIIEVPILCADRVEHGIRSFNIAKDVGWDLAELERALHASFPNIPVHVI
jgi:hypothetical protein